MCDSIEGASLSDPDHYTNAAIEDELVYSLYGVTTLILQGSKDGFPIRQKYVEQAKKNLYRINVFQPIPIFVINTSDLPPSLKKELEKIMHYPKQLEEIITGAVCRILEDVNPRYFRISGIRRNIKWRIDP